MMRRKTCPSTSMSYISLGVHRRLNRNLHPRLRNPRVVPVAIKAISLLHKGREPCSPLYPELPSTIRVRPGRRARSGIDQRWSIDVCSGDFVDTMLVCTSRPLRVDWNLSAPEDGILAR